jgi:hypothetical protein
MTPFVRHTMRFAPRAAAAAATERCRYMARAAPRRSSAKAECACRALHMRNSAVTFITRYTTAIWQAALRERRYSTRRRCRAECPEKRNQRRMRFTSHGEGRHMSNTHATITEADTKQRGRPIQLPFSTSSTKRPTRHEDEASRSSTTVQPQTSCCRQRNLFA